jgi:hypothetical protein
MGHAARQQILGIGLFRLVPAGVVHPPRLPLVAKPNSLEKPVVTRAADHRAIPACIAGIWPRRHTQFIEPVVDFRVTLVFVETPEPLEVNGNRVRIFLPIVVGLAARFLPVAENRQRQATSLLEAIAMTALDALARIAIGTLVVPGREDRTVLPARFVGVDVVV